MSDGSSELQAAVYTTLVGLTPALAAGGIHAPAKQDTPLPYVEIDDSDAVSADVVGRHGLTETLNIHVWAAVQPPTGVGGYLTVKKIISRIRDALHAQKLTVSGQSYAFANVSSTRIFNDADKTAIHGVVTITVNHFGLEE